MFFHGDGGGDLYNINEKCIKIIRISGYVKCTTSPIIIHPVGRIETEVFDGVKMP